MKNRFIVGLDTIQKEYEEKIVEYMKSNGFGWWHWIDNFWMVVDSQNKLSTKKLRDDLQNIAPKTSMMVIEVKAYTEWSGFGPNSKERNMFSWIRETWGSD